MDASNLSDYQLYEIVQNAKLHRDIRKIANDEFDKRQISIDRLQEIINRHDKQFKPDIEDKLDIKYKLLLIAFPFFIPVHGIIATRFIPVGHKKKTKQYWFYICVGYLFWTIVVILFAKFVLFTPNRSRLHP